MTTFAQLTDGDPTIRSDCQHRHGSIMEGYPEPCFRGKLKSSEDMRLVWV